MHVAAGDALNQAVAECAEPCRGDGTPCFDLVGRFAGEKGLLWVGEPEGRRAPESSPESPFPFFNLALQVARLVGLSEDELVLSLLPRCQPPEGAEWDLASAADRCRRHLTARLSASRTPPTVVAVGRGALVQILAAVRELTGEEPALAPFSPEEQEQEVAAAQRLGRFYFQAGEYRVVPLPALSGAGEGEPGRSQRLLIEFAGRVGRLCRATLYDQALERVRDLVPLAFREKVDAGGSTYFTPGNRRLLRILKRPRAVAAEFYAPDGRTCYVYRGTDLDRFLELVVDILTQAIG